MARSTGLIRVALATLAGLAACVTVVPASAGAASGAATPPRDALASFACHPAESPLSRSISVVSVMRPLSGTESMSVRFALAERVGQGAMTTVTSAPGLGTWLFPTNPTLGRRPGDVWKLSKAVYDLSAPATYRLLVDFRWLGRGGTVLATRQLESPACAQRELRPDLVVRRVRVMAAKGHAGGDRYRAMVANRGASASGPFDVLFSPGAGGASVTRSVGSLAPGESTVVVFSGPVCQPTAPPTIVADPTNMVDDSNRANNTLTVTCPAG